ncbi:methyltransferase domain-containing protein [Halomonas sp. 18H]|uniref:methyltransferase domain-containing protein n=1 Tax=Halomonas almeriensis TaxID=308163 RepID=UPI0022309DB2|nr:MULTISPECIES: methyltransferase domain-containing protein [Halomonas]MCW4149490.1 methyltransferase domain-containing protein [Halomonas sp. 18H]MDN3553564.1 methyltransferase domain-containing protein [Halomonas almeriensis]
MTTFSAHGDRHFDGMADKFADSLYASRRGALRLALLDRLLPEMLTLEAQPTLDIGGGLGQLSAWLAARGHPVTLCEPARDMRDQAFRRLAETTVELRDLSLQELPARMPGPWPLLTCHAVLEWMADPRAALATLAGLLAPDGQLSLMVFNRDAMRFSNLLKGNLERVMQDRLAGLGKGKRLAPISPLTHQDILTWAGETGLRVKHQAGIRVFDDYLQVAVDTPEMDDKLLELEWRYSRSEPYWRLGRYLLYTLVPASQDAEENCR